MGLRTVAAVEDDIPSLGDQHQVSLAQTSAIYAADGTLLAYLHGVENRTVISGKQIPQVLRNAVVAIEDERFYSHRGVDLESFVRALVTNVQAQQTTEGFSTITMQLVGNLYLDRTDLSFNRKFNEMALAWQLERKYSKDEILDLYLNTVYFGSNAYGVEAAAQTYFDKEPVDLTLAEAALIAGLPQAPTGLLASQASRTSSGTAQPRHPQDGRERLHHRRGGRGRAPHAGRACALFPLHPGAGAVRGRLCAQAAHRHVRRGQGVPGRSAGGDHHRSRLPEAGHRRHHLHAERAGRPLGGAGEHRARHRLHPGDGGRDRLRDAPSSISRLRAGASRAPPSRPSALDGGRRDGHRPLEDLLHVHAARDSRTREPPNRGRSRPSAATPTASPPWCRPPCAATTPCTPRLALDVGADRIVDIAHRMGITSYLNASPAIVLGGLTYGVSPLEMASAYGTLANQGEHVEPTIILQIKDSGRQGDLEGQPQDGLRPFPPAWPTTSPASSSRTSCTARAPRPRSTARPPARPVPLRTSATPGSADTRPHLSTTVWVGHPQGQIPMTDVHGAQRHRGKLPGADLAEVHGRGRQETIRRPISASPKCWCPTTRYFRSTYAAFPASTTTESTTTTLRRCRTRSPVRPPADRALDDPRCKLERFTLKAQEALAAAQKLAQERGHAQVEPEHLAVALLEQDGGLTYRYWSASARATPLSGPNSATRLEHFGTVHGDTQVGFARDTQTALDARRPRPTR